MTIYGASWNGTTHYYPTILEQESSTDQLIVLITFICCCVSATISIAGNLLVLLIIINTKEFRRNQTFIFIANVCVSDILISTLVVPFQFQITLLHRWILPWFLCYICPTVQVVMVSNSVFSLTAIAIERYQAVLYPLKAHLSKKLVKIELVIIWSISIVISIPTLISLKVFHFPLTLYNAIYAIKLSTPNSYSGRLGIRPKHWPGDMGSLSQ